MLVDALPVHSPNDPYSPFFLGVIDLALSFMKGKRRRGENQNGAASQH